MSGGIQLATAARKREHQNRMKAMSHSLRREILGIITERIASPSEMGDELGKTADAISYHVKRLVDLECAELVCEEKAAGTGAVAHYYRATSRDSVIREEWNDMDPVVGESFLVEIIERMLADFTRSAESARIGSDDRFILARTLHHFDAVGRDEALAVQEEARLKLVEIEERSRERVSELGAATQVHSAWQVCFEVPPSGTH